MAHDSLELYNALWTPDGARREGARQWMQDHAPVLDKVRGFGDTTFTDYVVLE